MSPDRQRGGPAPPRRPVALIGWLAAALVLAFSALAAAAFLQAPAWIWALLITGGACGLAAAMALALILRFLAGPAAYLKWAALISAVAAMTARQSLLAELNQDPLAAVTVDFVRLALASSSVVWGGVALVWGAAVISGALEVRARRGGGYREVGPLLAGGMAVTLALYGLGPLWALAGMRLNHWTLLGLVGLAGVAYAAGALYRRIFSA